MPAEGFRAALLAVVCASTSAAAADEPLLQLSLDASPACATLEQFESRLHQRLNGRELWASDGAVRAEVRIRADERGASGELVLYDARGAASERLISAASCAEVLDGLALITALVLQREQQAEAEPEVVVPTQPVEPVRKPQLRTAEVQRLEPPPSEQLGIVPELSTSGLVLSAPLPGIAPGLELSAGLAFPLWGAHALIRGGLRLTPHEDLQVDQGTANFEWWSSLLLLCPRLLEASTSVTIAPCALLELGQIEASGASTLNPRSERRVWLAPGVAALMRWEFFGPLGLELSGEAIFPLARDRFILGPDVVHEIPAVGARARLGFAVHFE